MLHSLNNPDILDPGDYTGSWVNLLMSNLPYTERPQSGLREYEIPGSDEAWWMLEVEVFFRESTFLLT